MTVLLFDTFQGRLRMEGLLTTRTGLHIGAGGTGNPLGTDLPIVRDGAGRPYIPGSSLKGVVRSAAEALLHGAPFADSPSDKDLWSCRMMSGEPCVTHQEVNQDREKKENEERERRAKDAEVAVPIDVSREVAKFVWKESCTICRLFGSLAIASRVRIPDLPLVGDLPGLELRNGVGIDRDKGLAANAVLYDFEAVPPGTSFRLTVLLDNPEESDAGLLLYLFQELHEGNLAIGGKASRGLGRVRIDWESIVETEIRKGNPFAALLSSRDLLKPQTQEGGIPEEAVQAGPKLPTSGDPAVWQTLADLLLKLPEVDKGLLSAEAGPLGLTKATLNEKLALGLDGKGVRRTWDVIIDKFVACGFLVEREGQLTIAARVAVEEKAGDTESGRPAPALQAVIDRFVGALARRWQEAC